MKRKQELRDLRAFGLGAAWALPMIEFIRELIESGYTLIRWDLLLISILISAVFMFAGRDN